MNASDWLTVVSGVISTVGFVILFRAAPKHWVFAALDGFAACLVFILCSHWLDGLLLPDIFAAFAAAMLAELFAVLCKAPSTVFLLPGCIALVPGGSLFYGMKYLLEKNYDASLSSFYDTLVVSVGIGVGIIAAAFVCYLLRRIVGLLRKSSGKETES